MQAQFPPWGARWAGTSEQKLPAISVSLPRGFSDSSKGYYKHLFLKAIIPIIAMRTHLALRELVLLLLLCLSTLLTTMFPLGISRKTNSSSPNLLHVLPDSIEVQYTVFLLVAIEKSRSSLIRPDLGEYIVEVWWE
jgi:hypothetical protein